MGICKYMYLDMRASVYIDRLEGRRRSANELRTVMSDCICSRSSPGLRSSLYRLRDLQQRGAVDVVFVFSHRFCRPSERSGSFGNACASLHP